jgi:methylenetetrahydrofolate dehydrogenase (NADP+) / methenyltetrahydrofolate cyclohydrolase
LTARVLDGKAIASSILETVHVRVAALRRRGVVPGLAFVVVGSSEPTELYVARLTKLGKRVEIDVLVRALPADTTVEQLEQEVSTINADASVDGIVIQMPLPEGLAVARLSSVLDARKDVDGITIESAGRLYQGLPTHAPSTALAMVRILASSGIEVRGKHAVIVGRSNVVGHPLAELLMRADATTTITHSKSGDLSGYTRQADILALAVGRPALIKGEMIKPGAVVLDAGINVTPEGVVGDSDFEGCVALASAITPVPGGVGPVTNAVLLSSVVESASQRPD